jgi:hypothetical protein
VSHEPPGTAIGKGSLAWSCAANLQLYDEDPGRRKTNVGNRNEPRMVDRRDALVHLYARQVLLGLDADNQRIVALAEDCRCRAAEARSLRGAWRLVQTRRRAPNPESWTSALGALSWSARREIASVWALAAELADAAAGMVRQAGADRDTKARARLLASTRHTFTYDVVGNIVGAEVEAQAAAELAQTSRDIDESKA